MEVGAMLEMGEATPGGRLMGTELVDEEPRVDKSRLRARMTLRIQRAKVEPANQATEAMHIVHSTERPRISRARGKEEPDRAKRL